MELHGVESARGMNAAEWRRGVRRRRPDVRRPCGAGWSRRGWAHMHGFRWALGVVPNIAESRREERCVGEVLGGLKLELPGHGRR
jgi:hypothetical protein